LGVRLLRLEGRHSIPLLLSSAEYILGMSLSSGKGYIVEGYAGERGVVLGLYTAVPPEAGWEGIYRRLTGGGPAELEPGDMYVALTVRAGRLADLAQAARRLSECLQARAWGTTIVEDWGVVEVLGASLGTVECVESTLHTVVEGCGKLPGEPLRHKARMYSQPSWRLYTIPERPTLVWASAHKPEGWLKIAVEPYEDYIADIWLSGVFNASPPMEPFSLIATLKGVRLDDVVMANLEVALEHRLELYGISREDFLSILQSIGFKLGTLNLLRD